MNFSKLNYFALIMILFSYSVHAETARFFSSMQDVPLVVGINELPDQTLVYDKPEGRIVESVAEVNSGTFDSIRKAYDETLPQLGWRKIADNTYTRQGEFLTMNYEAIDGRNFLKVMVRPK